MNDYDDVDIAARIMCGEETGIEDLIENLGGKAAGALRTKFPDIPQEDRDWALRYAAYKAIRGIETFDERKASLAGWFISIAFNVVIDMLRKGKTDFHKDMQESMDTLEDVNAPTPFSEEPESRIDEKQLEDLDKAIEELPAQLKRVARADLAAEGKANDKDLAQELGVANSSVRQYRKRYKETLYVLMSKRGHTKTKRRVG